MEQSVARLQAQLMKDYYKDFSKYTKGRIPEHKVAWVTAFTPVEILEALDIAYYYPESYAAVIAASGKEQTLIQESTKLALSSDCCSYSCCFEGSISLEQGPRGIPPKPDVLIATNNQCNTLPNWWNILAERYDVPLIVLDYPGETVERDIACDYVTQQHKAFIAEMEKLSGRKLQLDKLEDLIRNSEKSVSAWQKVVGEFSKRNINPTALFDGISFLITSRCKAETSQLYMAMADEYRELQPTDDELIPIFWLGYPLWYHPARYLTEILDGYRISGSNYITWWSLDYSGKDSFEKLFQAYNYTFLNLTQKTRTERLSKCIAESNAVGAITLRNKSCKCDFVSAKNVGLPQVEIEIDMIDRNYLDVEKAKARMEIFKEILCTI